MRCTRPLPQWTQALTLKPLQCVCLSIRAHINRAVAATNMPFCACRLLKDAELSDDAGWLEKHEPSTCLSCRLAVRFFSLDEQLQSPLLTAVEAGQESATSPPGAERRSLDRLTIQASLCTAKKNVLP